MPPLGCGQMLFEIISLLVDAAAGKPHVSSYVHQIAPDHVSFKVLDLTLCDDFLQALVDALADLLGSGGTAARAQAWAPQSQALLHKLPGANTAP
jgi:hemoglobin-like flavoprotein